MNSFEPKVVWNGNSYRVVQVKSVKELGLDRFILEHNHIDSLKNSSWRFVSGDLTAANVANIIGEGAVEKE